VTLPAENQQTVEALAETIARPLTLMAGVLNDEACADALAALRDLVAQAELVGEMADLIASHHSCTNMGCQFCALLARLDGAR
jgi:hypothetical protein